MPNKKTLEQKKQAVERLTEKLSKARAGVLIDYKGINVEQDTRLRAEFRAAGVDYFVAKNTLLRFAVRSAGLSDLEPDLVGSTSVALSPDDYVFAAKIAAKYSGELGEIFNIKAGIADGKALSASEVERFAKLASKEELISSALRGLNAPITGLVHVLVANLRGLVGALDAIAQKQSGK